MKLQPTINNPHYQIASFFYCDENNMESFRFGMIDLVKTACSDRYYGNQKNHHHNHQQFLKLLELAHVLQDSQEDFKLRINHPLYRFCDRPFSALNFPTLSDIEVNNIRLFFEEFFNYRDLEAWRGILDALLNCSHGKTSLDKSYNSKLHESVLISEYIAKMIEAMRLICETKSLPYILLHHAGDFKTEEEEKKSLSAVINFIADVIEPEMIYCLNHQTDNDGRDHADLILVIPEEYPQKFEEIKRVINFVFLKHLHLSCTLFKSTFFHKMVTEGHIYFSMACNTESLVYHDTSKPLPKLRTDRRQEKIKKTNHDFYAGFTKARTFYTAAEAYRNNNVILSAFMLHQAAELCINALIKSLTTQDKSTHSIGILLRFSLRLSPKLALQMNNGSAEDERLLTVFEGAYLGYRYSEKYNIDTQDLNILFEKVKTMHDTAEETFLNWMDRYERLLNTAKNEQ
ncbi:HEPN domain-containing protein [Pedobacter gandavensis]|uniref:HEPN domain-containing protein n=1 Tax=Pedobacter gandavensis TaxID=2679963 RepID=UPI00292E9906|nr:HEPN domain-containing protein [Pedobacter gandavensis]